MRVGIVDDDTILARSLAQALTAASGFELAGMAESLAEGAALLDRGVDVLLVDLGLPDGSGLDLISLARALSFNGLANAQMIVALNAGAHANPCFAGDTVRAWSEVLDRAETQVASVGALRLRLVATKGKAGELRGADGKYLPEVLLDLDYWALVPR